MGQSSQKDNCRTNSPRDLFKFCQRIVNITRAGDDEATCYFLDALDCFVHHMPDAEFKRRLLGFLGSVFNMNAVNVENVLNHRVCRIATDPVRDNLLLVGRVELMKKERAAKDSIKYVLGL